MARRGGKKGREEEVEEVDVGPPPVIKHFDMPKEMVDFVVATAQEALKENKIAKDIATAIKRKCDEVHAGSWHAIVGQSYGVSLTHETTYLVFFTIGLQNFCVFKTLDDDTPISTE
uniref:Dynein light chain n=1 Tax=Bicosoecida sp. CB-2014 TaxID=1486930 RepID=A0A7S1CML1_9STRA|mmetsp:Transcript_4368/g.16056  ORF Transcript_4368/g.16056 Transcript_4368/m.16056 type:complete len:116 (+) Transcript_4368:180-527(+)